MKHHYSLFGFLFLPLLLFLTSCSATGFTIESIGKTEFEEYSGEYELGNYILPSNDFMSRFPHTDEEYHFLARYRHKLSILGEEMLIITARYEPDIYKEAKTYCLNNMLLVNLEVPDYNGFHFMENIMLEVARGNDDQSDVSSFPSDFNMLAYNDKECRLAFMGYVSPTLTTREKDREKMVNSWAEFIETRFPEIAKENN